MSQEELLSDLAGVPEFKRSLNNFLAGINRGTTPRSKMLWVDANNPVPKAGAMNSEIEYMQIGGPAQPNYDFMTHLPMLAEFRGGGSPTEMPQAMIDALTTDKALRSISLNGDISHLNLRVLDALPKLSELNLENTKMTSATIDAIASLPSLESFDLAQPTIELSDIPKLCQIANIADLTLENLPAECANFQFLQKFHRLKRLTMRACAASGHGVELAKIKGLETLSAFPLNEADVAALGDCPTLSSLHLMGCKITGVALHHLSRCPLKYLSLDGCELTDGALRQVSAIQTLKVLDLTGTLCDENDIQVLASLKQLKLLKLSWANWTSPWAAKSLSKKLPECIIDGQIEVENSSPGIDVQTSTTGYLAASWDYPYWTAGKLKTAEFEHNLRSQVETGSSPHQGLAIYADLARMLLSENRLVECTAACKRGLSLAQKTTASTSKLKSTDLKQYRHASADAMEEHGERRNEIVLRLVLARCLYRLQKPREAESVLIDLPHLYTYNPSHELSRLYALYDMARSISKRSADTEANIETFLNICDSDYRVVANGKAGPRLQIALQYADIGDYGRAFQWQRAATDLVTKNYQYDSFVCDWVKAQLLSGTNQDKKALALYESILKSADIFRADSAFTLADICDSCADLMDKEGRHNQAKALRKTATVVRIDPRYHSIRSFHSIQVNPPILLNIGN